MSDHVGHHKYLFSHNEPHILYLCILPTGAIILTDRSQSICALRMVSVLVSVVVLLAITSARGDPTGVVVSTFIVYFSSITDNQNNN